MVWEDGGSNPASYPIKFLSQNPDKSHYITESSSFSLFVVFLTGFTVFQSVFEVLMSSDKYYVDRCLDGHPDDFRYLVRRYQKVLMAHLVGQLGNVSEAEEIAQETLVRCYFGLSKLKKRKSFFPWMLGISNRVAKEQHRNRQRRRETLGALAEKKPQRPVQYDYPLARTVAQLPDFYRELILLRYYGDQSCKEIAKELDMPLGTITKTLSRAYAVLREKLGKPAGNMECEVQK